MFVSSGIRALDLRAMVTDGASGAQGAKITEISPYFHPPPATSEPYRYHHHQPSPPPAPTVPDPQQQHHYHQGVWYSNSQGYYQPSPPSSTYSAQPYPQPHTHFNESQTNSLIYGPPPPSTYSAQLQTSYPFHPYSQNSNSGRATSFSPPQPNPIYGPPPLPWQTSYPSHQYSQNLDSGPLPTPASYYAPPPQPDLYPPPQHNLHTTNINGHSLTHQFPHVSQIPSPHRLPSNQNQWVPLPQAAHVIPSPSSPPPQRNPYPLPPQPNHTEFCQLSLGSPAHTGTSQLRATNPSCSPLLSDVPEHKEVPHSGPASALVGEHEKLSPPVSVAVTDKLTLSSPNLHRGDVAVTSNIHSGPASALVEDPACVVVKDVENTLQQQESVIFDSALKISFEGRNNVNVAANEEKPEREHVIDGDANKLDDYAVSSLRMQLGAPPFSSIPSSSLVYSMTGNIRICEKPVVLMGLHTPPTSRVIVRIEHDSLVGITLVNGVRVSENDSPEKGGVMSRTGEPSHSYQHNRRVGEGYSGSLWLYSMPCLPVLVPLSMSQPFDKACYGADVLYLFKEMQEKGMTWNVLLSPTFFSVCAYLRYTGQAIVPFTDMKHSKAWLYVIGQLFLCIKKTVLNDGDSQPVIDFLSSSCLVRQRDAALVLGQCSAVDSGCLAHILTSRLVHDTHTQVGISHYGGIMSLHKILDLLNAYAQCNTWIALSVLEYNAILVTIVPSLFIHAWEFNFDSLEPPLPTSGHFEQLLWDGDSFSVCKLSGTVELPELVAAYLSESHIIFYHTPLSMCPYIAGSDHSDPDIAIGEHTASSETWKSVSWTFSSLFLAYSGRRKLSATETASMTYQAGGVLADLGHSFPKPCSLVNLFVGLKRAFWLCQVALPCMRIYERILCLGGFSYDHEESSRALRRLQYSLLLSYFQYRGHMLDHAISYIVLQFFNVLHQATSDLSSLSTLQQSLPQTLRLQMMLGLNHFRLVKRLGWGDIGSVYLSELLGTRTCFAMMVMDKAQLAGRKKLLRAQTEREILQSLDHPFLPTLYSHFETEKFTCLLMEYCPGGDLHALRQKQPGKYFLEHAARFNVAEVLLALEYLHMLKISFDKNRLVCKWLFGVQFSRMVQLSYSIAATGMEIHVLMLTACYAAVGLVLAISLAYELVEKPQCVKTLILNVKLEDKFH